MHPFADVIIGILFRSPLRLWQQRLADELRAAGHEVKFVADAAPRSSLPLGVGSALALERRLFGPSASLFDPAPPPPESAVDPANLVIALDGATSQAARVLEPRFDGATGDAALLAMLAHGGTPQVRVRLSGQGAAADLVWGALGVEDRNNLSRALDQTLARIVSLLLQAVRRFERQAPPVTPPAEGSAVAVAGPLGAMIRGVARKVAGRLPGGRVSPNHWRIGYRRVENLGVAEVRAWRGPFTILPGRADRFYADPMPFSHQARNMIFFEDLPYATDKGVIGLVEIAPDGSASAPRTVLEQSFHLSYPFIIRHGGEVYMLPETSAAGRVQLFRADPFPDRWLPDRVLLEGVIAADATPIEHDGRWWMFATLAGDGGSSWDQLGLFHAPDLLGPWMPHEDNPVLVDAGAARPAGAMWHEGGALMRVAQDCRGGYGVGLAICRVDRLDEGGYAQSVVQRLGPPCDGADGVHTLNRAGDLEVIDLRYPRRRAILGARVHG